MMLIDLLLYELKLLRNYFSMLLKEWS